MPRFPMGAMIPSHYDWARWISATSRPASRPRFFGDVVRELVRLEVVERSLALASKLFVAVIPLSIIISAIVPGADNFGDSLVNRLGLTGAGAEATRNLFATQGEIRGAVSVLGVVILLYSVFSFTKGLQRVYLDVWQLPTQQFEALVRLRRGRDRCGGGGGCLGPARPHAARPALILRAGAAVLLSEVKRCPSRAVEGTGPTKSPQPGHPSVRCELQPRAGRPGR